MFQLLAILLVLYFSSKGDGAPIVGVVDNSQNKAISDSFNTSDLIVNEGMNEITDVFASTKQGLPLPGGKEVIRTSGAGPILKLRALGECSPTETSAFKEYKTRSTRSGETTSSNASKYPENTESKGSNTSGITRDDPDQHSKGKKRKSFTGTENASEHQKQDRADRMVYDVRQLLSERGANPHKDEILAQLIKTAIIRYNDAYDRHWTGLGDLKEKDRESCISIMMEELKTIYEDLDARNGTIRYPDSDEGEREPSSGQVKHLSALQKQERAERMVYDVRQLLSERGANPHGDKVLAQLIKTAIYQYNDAYHRDWLGLGDLGEEDNESRLDIMMKEMRKIFKDLNSRNGNIAPLEFLSPVVKRKRRATSKKRPSSHKKRTR